MKTTITVTDTLNFHPGQYVRLHSIENRWWRRLYYFCTFRRCPLRITQGRITEVASTVITLETPEHIQ